MMRPSSNTYSSYTGQVPEHAPPAMATNFSPGFHCGMPPEGEPAAYGRTSGFSAKAGRASNTVASAAAKGYFMVPKLTLTGSALHDVHGEAAARSFLVLGLHVRTGLAHGLDDLVEGHVVRAITAQRHARHVDGLGGTDGIAFDAGDLHEPAHRIAGEAEVMLH